MFEFGKDLRRIFIQAREGEDRTWLELIGAELLEAEAKQQCVDAGRISCRRPADAWLRASVLWLEHARRSGRRESLERALNSVSEARRAGADPIEADLAEACARLVNHDLRGCASSLDQAVALIDAQPQKARPATTARIAGLHALARSRQARHDGGEGARKAAAALLDAALHALKPHAALVVERAEVRLERAMLTLESGMIARNPGLLDQAGRDLSVLVAECGADDRPITRARALTLCAAGLSSLATMAGDADAGKRAGEMFDAAADSFTPDHSALDWIAVILARSPRVPATDVELQLARRLTAGQGLVLGALTLNRQLSQAIDAAQARGDAARLISLETECHARLRTQAAATAPLDWVVEQIAIAQARLARRRFDSSVPGGDLAIALIQAAEVARDHGCDDLAAKASGLNAAILASARPC